MKLEVGELELATIKTALTFFAECMRADDERRGPKFLPFQCVDANIGALTPDEIDVYLETLEQESDPSVRAATLLGRGALLEAAQHGSELGTADDD